jgi:class 3 adenylate cyclase
MAGVVGKERMQFDVFGDDVNIASRFESSGEEGRINVSENTYLQTKDCFEFEERGLVHLKNKESMKAYFVKREL